MKFGLKDKELSYILETVVKPLESSGAKVWCFGSRARGTHSKFSDLDLLIESSSNLSQQIGLINEELENGNFPLKVDLVEERNLADSYRPSVEKDKIRFTT